MCFDFLIKAESVARRFSFYNAQFYHTVQKYMLTSRKNGQKTFSVRGQ